MKRVTLLVPENTVSLIIASLVLKDDGKISMGQLTLSTETINNEYFVLGDNRNHSEDSRFSDVGAVRKEQIVGRVIYRIFPFRKAGRVR